MQKTLLLVLLLAFHSSYFAQSESEKLNEQPYSLLNIPNLTGDNISGQVVIAVIDDGFLLSHDLLKDYIWINKDEIPSNGIDDDLNGFIDDYSGWDISDMDADVVPKKELLEEYYHGTMVASIIIQTFIKAYDDEASQHIKIMPIKVLSDLADGPSMEQGYKAIEYASVNGADIICMAWNGGTLEVEHAAFIEEAIKNNILLFGSAGNESSTYIGMPAALSSVYCVASIDDNYKKTIESNYSTLVDWVAFGSDVKAAHPIAKNAYFNGHGTSAAVSLVCGSAGILKSFYPDVSHFELMQALKYTAEPVDFLNLRYLGRLGTGVPNVSGAIDYLQDEDKRNAYFNSYRTAGIVYNFQKNENDSYSTLLNLPSGIESIQLNPTFINKGSKNCLVSIVTQDDTILHTPLKDFPLNYEVKGNSCTLFLRNCSKRIQPTFSYKALPIDSTKLYCSDTKELTESSGIITDGSGIDTYANLSSCKWLIKVTDGKRVAISLQKLDLEEDVDQILIFNGNNTRQENLLARFSGTQLPPRMVTNTNEILIWFTSNSSITQDGFEIHYEAVDEEPGIY